MFLKSSVRVLALSALLLVALSFGAMAQDEEVTLNVIGLTVPPNEIGTPLDISRQEFVDAFAEAYPNITLNRVEAPPEFDTAILLDLAAGTAPDVWYQGSGNLPNLVAAGGILDMNVCLTEVPELTLDRFTPGFLDLHQREDGLWGLPDGGTPMVFYYNPEAFERAGVEIPANDWTWDDYLDVAQRLTLDSEGRNSLDPDFDRENVVQYGTRVRRFLLDWYSFVWQAGGDFISPDGTTVDGYLNSPETIEALTFLRDLVLVHGVAPEPSTLDQMVQEVGFLDVFLRGEVATFPRGHWELVGLRNQEAYTPERVGVIPNPRYREAATVIFESGWVINSAVANDPAKLKAACQLVERLTDIEFQRSKVVSGLEISANAAAAEEATETSEYPELTAQFVDALQYGRADYAGIIPGWAVRVEEPLTLMMENILAGADVEEEVAIAVEEINRELARTR